MRPPDLLSFEQAATQLGVAESELDDLIDGGKLTTQPYLGDVYLSAEEVAARVNSQPAAAKPAPEPGPSPNAAKISRIKDLLATGLREVRPAQARELLGIGLNQMDKLGREGRVNYELRKGRRWYLLEDIETYARLQNIWANKSGAWTPYGKLDAHRSYLDLDLAAPARPKPMSAVLPQSDED